MNNNRFMQCTGCNAWLSVHDVLENPRLQPIGMAFSVRRKDLALYYFNHDVPQCGTTFLVDVNQLADFVLEDIPRRSLAETEECCGHCTSLDDLHECHMDCQFAPFRRFLFEMIEMKKRVQAGAPTGETRILTTV